MTSKKPRRKNTVAQAKNIMRRAIEEIIDPGPRSIEALWSHFESKCAYCEADLNHDRREGQVDHASTSGGNHLGNLVLACGACNGDEKREESWETFLRKKAKDQSDFERREERILTWFALNPRPPHKEGPEVDRLRKELDQLILEFGIKCSELKKVVEPS